MKNRREFLKIGVVVLSIMLIIGIVWEVQIASKETLQSDGTIHEYEANNAQIVNNEIVTPEVKTALSNEQGNAIAMNNKVVYDSYVKEVYALINQERTAAGVSSVTYDDTLTLMAMHRAAENAYIDWFETDGIHHIRPNGEYASSICDYYKQYGSFGENLGRYQASAVEIVQGWHDSPAHYQCMISRKYKRVGIGIAQDSEGYYYWAAIFMN